MSDFLAENNRCGQTILQIVSKGNGILADLFRLTDNIPSVFRLQNKTDVTKYGPIITDFSYFSGPEAFEKKIETSPALTELDQELRENYLELLSNFYFLFESIFNYISQLNRFIEDVHEGIYIQMSLEAVLYDKEGKQLMTESIFLYGVMLLLVDILIDGVVRERMLTSFYRYAGAFQTETHIDEVCKLFRTTGFSPIKKPAGYPQDYFKRVPVNETFIKMTLGVLRSDDIYLQFGSAYLLPEHRSTAFAVQASMLVIILYFSPMVLHSDNATMREITDKFFPDNWIVPVYMGFCINLVEWWDSFKSAKLALANTIEVSRVKQIASEKGAKVEDLIAQTSNFLKEGLLTEDNVLEKVSKVINLLRDCNVTLRWTILHCHHMKTSVITEKRIKQLRDIVLYDIKHDNETAVTFLLNIAQLELKIKDLFRKLLSEKEERWNDYQKEANERIKELSEVFSGTKPLSRIEKNENLHQWLETKSTEVVSLNFDDIKRSGRKLVELIRAFDEMLEFHGLESKVQVREWVTEIISCFHKMLRTGSINEDKLVTIQIVEDLGYAWGPIMDGYTAQMRALISKDPSGVSRLRAVFLKLSSAMDFPLMRIGQAKANNLLSTVSSYYSGKLVAYVQKVLQIIPRSVFNILHEIIELQTNSIRELPTRLDKDKVKEFAQLEDRQKVSRLTHHMSVLAEGILMMQTTLVGVIKIDPKKLLENGIRKELVQQVCNVLQENLTFPTKSGIKREAELLTKLKIIAKRFDGICRSFEYIGDYVGSNGLKIFYEELARVLNFFTEQECNNFSKNKVLHFQSIYQSKDIPIPIPSNLLGTNSQSTIDSDSNASTFLGRLANELILLTDAKSTSYLTATNTWYDLKSHTPVLTPDYFSLMEKGLGIAGLVGLDKVLSFMIVHHLETLTKGLRNETTERSEFLSSLEAQLMPCSKIIEFPLKKYAAWFKIIKTSSIDCSTILQKIGQLQLLRKRIQYQLRVAASFQAKQLQSMMKVLNNLMAEVEMSATENPTTQNAFIEDDASNLAFETLNHSEPLGLFDPYSKIYITLEPIPNVCLYLHLTIVNQLHKLTYSKSLGSLICRKASEPADGIPYVIGLSTFLSQLNPAHIFSMLSFISQYLNSLVVHLHSTSGGGGLLNKEDVQELSATYYLLITLSRVHPRRGEIITWIHQMVPCFRIIPNLFTAGGT